MLKILLLSRYDYSGPSSRYRSYQYLPFLSRNSCMITEEPLLDSTYVSRFFGQYGFNKFSLLTAYIKRIFKLISSQNYDLIWIEKEALPWIPAPLELLLYRFNKPLVVDYDDAIFHRYDQHPERLVNFFLGQKIDRIMARANLVIVGNPYLAQRAYSAGAKWVEIIPTVVDLSRYPKSPKDYCNGKFIIGWIGSPNTYKYLKQIEPILENFSSQVNCEVHAIGGGEKPLENIIFRNIQWTEQDEIKNLSHFDVGIMPLPDGPLQRGKCGFKLIQYMACFLPTIGSPVGVNTQIISNNQTGFLASTCDEWITALTILSQSKERRKEFGILGRKKVEAEYNLQITSLKLLQLFSSLVSSSPKKI